MSYACLSCPGRAIMPDVIQSRNKQALTAIMAFAMPVISAVAGARDVLFSARPIISGAARVHRILPVRVDLRTMGPFEGKIVIRLGGIPGSRTVQPLSVGPGLFKFEIPVPVGQTPLDNTVTVVLEDKNRRMAAEKEFYVQFAGSTFYSQDGRNRRTIMVGWVGRDTGSAYGPHDLPTRQPLSAFSQGKISAADLPEDWRMYTAIDCLVLPGSLAKLSDKQADALEKWMRAGGQVVVDSSCGEPEAEQNRLFKRFGIMVGEGKTKADVRHKVEIREDYSTKARTNLAATLSVVLRPITAGDARSCDTSSLRAILPRGLGCLVLTCVDLNAFLGANAQDAVAVEFLREVITGERSDSATGGYGGSPYYYQHGWNWIPAWGRSLFKMTALEQIPAALVITFLALFTVLVCPAERIVLGRFHLLRWTWVATTVLVVIFCLFAGVLSRAVRGVKARRSMLCVHNYAQERGGTHVMFDCVVPATARSFTARYGPDDVAMDVAASGSGSTALFNAGRNAMEFASPVWSPRFLTTLRFHNDEPPFRASLAVNSGKLSGYAEPVAAGLDVEESWLVWNGRPYAMVPDGGKWRVGGQMETNSLWKVWTDGIETVCAPEDRSGERSPLERVMFLDMEEPFGCAAAMFFDAAPLRRAAGTPAVAVIVAKCRKGEEVDLDAANARVSAVHVVRQMVKVER